MANPPSNSRLRQPERGTSTAAGFLVIDKPLHITSMDAISTIRVKLAGGDRKAARRIKVGHAGTLDPLATGVLVVAVGSATKFISRLMNTSKRYVTTIDLSAFTTTDDAEGTRSEVLVANLPSEITVRAAISRFVGSFLQQPPMFSAKKLAGRRAYELARAGESPQLAPREVVVHSLELIEYRWPLVTLNIHCDKGFYVRSLARELGQALGTGGHCVSIQRTAVGPFTIETAHQLAALPSPLTEADLLNVASTLSLLDSAEDAAECAG